MIENKSTTQTNKRIAKNTLMLYFRTMLTMLVTLYTSRVILNTLGVDDFGIYNVVGGVVVMFAFLNNAMSNATQRFISYELGKGNFDQLKRIFNATQIIHIGIALLIFVLAETVGLAFVKAYLVIPQERVEAAIWVYHFSVLSFMVTFIQVPYNATIIAHERMNVYAYVSVLEVSLKLVIVFILTWISFDKLKLYGILHFCVVVFVAFIYRIYVRRNFVESKFHFVRERQLYIMLLSYSGWNLFGNLAAVAKGQGVNILLNIFFGPVVNAARGVATQVQAAINSFVSNFQIAVNPQIIKSYASGDNDYMTTLVISSSKLSFYLLFMLSLPIMLEVDKILELWLSIVPEYTSVFTILVLIVILIDCLSGSLMTAVQATGKIKMYQFVVGSLQLMILPISYIYLNLGYSPVVPLYINVVISIIALIFRVIFLKKLLNFPALRFVKEVGSRCILVIALSPLAPLILQHYFEPDYLRLFLVTTASLVSASVVIYTVGLNSVEREFILTTIKKIKNR